MNHEVIRLSHISKKFKDEPVLKDLNASLAEGEILGFLGPSGAGKTTTIKIGPMALISHRFRRP